MPAGTTDSIFTDTLRAFSNGEEREGTLSFESRHFRGCGIVLVVALDIRTARPQLSGNVTGRDARP